MAVERRVINPWTWQDEFGFPQAREVKGIGRTLYCTGQASTDSGGHAVYSGDISAQLRQSFDNLDHVLGAAGMALSDVVRLTVYATDVDELFAHWDELKARLAEGNCLPALTLVGVTRLAYPELLVEIEATAVA